MSGLVILLWLQDDLRVETKKYAASPAVAAFVQQIPALKQNAFRRLGDALQVKADPSKVIVRITDAVAWDASRWVVHDGTAMETYSRSETVFIDVYAEYLVIGAEDPARRFEHEVVHAVMRLDLGARYADVPTWLREGMAVHLAGQTEGRMRYMLMMETYARDPSRLVNGLGGTHTFADYVEDALAVEYLLLKITLPELERKLREGKEYLPDGFEAGAREYALKRLQAWRDDVNRDYVALLDLVAGQRWKEVEESCRRFLKHHEASYLRSPVSYYLARALFEQGSFDEALCAFEAFRRTVRGGEGMSGLLDDAKVREALCLRRLKKLEAAAERLRQVVHDHVDSSELPRAAYLLGFTLKDLGRTEDAKQVLRKALESFPGQPMADEARRALGD